MLHDCALRVQVAMDMKAQGMYVCRTLSFEGEPMPLPLPSPSLPCSMQSLHCATKPLPAHMSCQHPAFTSCMLPFVRP